MTANKFIPRLFLLYVCVCSRFIYSHHSSHGVLCCGSCPRIPHFLISLARVIFPLPLLKTRAVSLHPLLLHLPFMFTFTSHTLSILVFYAPVYIGFSSPHLPCLAPPHSTPSTNRSIYRPQTPPRLPSWFSPLAPTVRLPRRALVSAPIMRPA